MKKKSPSFMPQKRVGRGAKASCFGRFLHPSAQIREWYPNEWRHVRIEGLLVQRREDKDVRRGSGAKPCLFFRHEDFEVELYANERNVTITEEGPTTFDGDNDEPNELNAQNERGRIEQDED